MILRLAVIACFALGMSSVPSGAQQLPPPPVPPQNPLTESKRILGKLLFWEEQLSSTDTIACGSCHQPLAGGSDPRVGVNPGPDLLAPSPDDILGSPGVVRHDENGVPIADPVFDSAPQVTRRTANTTIGAAYVPALFWDGRAAPIFTDPESGAVSIPQGGALESQALGPILSDVEMAHEGRSWSDVRFKLERSLPLRDATSLPGDLAAALATNPSYPELFAAAFGDPEITAERIAFAIATYERTLVPNQTPWDRFVAGNPAALSPNQVQGWNFFNNSPCRVCHTPPTFSNNSFRNIGIRPPDEDLGRQEVTGLVQDRGRFKVPTLRNVGLKPTFMHNGLQPTVTDAVLWYRPNNPARAVDNLDPILPVGVPPNVLPQLVDFLTNGLTDPRVAAETAPFDRPRLHGGAMEAISIGADRATVSWNAIADASRYRVYRGELASLANLGPDGLPAAGYGSCISDTDPDPTDTILIDGDLPAPETGYFYLRGVLDGTGVERGLGATSWGRARFVLAPCP